jgi:hypothetical protein
MLSRFKHAALSVVGASANRPDREKLKTAIAARQTAQQAVVESRETVERLQAVVDQADDAARTAATATHEATEARRQWVRGGCVHSASRELEHLDAVAAEAADVAKRAAVDANVIGKTGTLASAQSVLQSSQADVRYREKEIATETGAILAEEAAPLLAQLERAAAEYRLLRSQVKALQRVLDPPMYTDATAKSQDGARAIMAALVRATIRSWDEERDAADARDFVDGERGRDAATLEQMTLKWRERAAQLRADPDA